MRRFRHVAAALRATLAVLVSFGVLRLTDAEIGSLILALELWGMALLNPSRRRKS